MNPNDNWAIYDVPDFLEMLAEDPSIWREVLDAAIAGTKAKTDLTAVLHVSGQQTAEIERLNSRQVELLASVREAIEWGKRLEQRFAMSNEPNMQRGLAQWNREALAAIAKAEGNPTP